MKIIGWNVDTQRDFMNPDGGLPVEDATSIKPNLKRVTETLDAYKILKVNTGDLHDENSEEISDTPDFVTTYPPHCMEGTLGAEFIEETKPKNPYVISWKDVRAPGRAGDELYQPADIEARIDGGIRDFVFYKDEFNVFGPLGNQAADDLLDIVKPDRVIVYGVATNVCVNFAVQGLLERVPEVYVVKDAIKELPAELAAEPLEATLAKWEGAKFITTSELEAYIR